ncbi:MAG: magnesium/cobalt transporter CorA [bacterium]
MADAESKNLKIGLPPGTLIPEGWEETDRPGQLSAMQYDPAGYAEFNQITPEQVRELMEEPRGLWLSLEGVHDSDLVQRLGTVLDMPPLLLEDIVSARQRPKAEHHGEWLLVTLKTMRIDPNELEVRTIQVSLALRNHVVVSFQAAGDHPFDPVRERIRRGNGRIRKVLGDYLLYALLDLIVDQGFLLLEDLQGVLAELEEEVLGKPSEEVMERIYRLHQQVQALHRLAVPVQDLCEDLNPEYCEWISEDSLPFLQDLKDHAERIAESLHGIQDALLGLINLNVSLIGFRTNERMRVLAVISTIFMPLTFLAGIYGMNFAFMPELTWRWGYPAALGAMGVIALLVLWLLRRKNWL